MKSEMPLPNLQELLAKLIEDHGEEAVAEAIEQVLIEDSKKK